MPLRIYALALLHAILGASCALAPGETGGGTMLTRTSAPLIGAWEKLTQSPCSQVYPHRLRFDETGNYRGQPDVTGGFTLWDVGTFEVAEPTRVKLSTANDAVVAYTFALANGVLTFVDAQGCEVRYRRAS